MSTMNHGDKFTHDGKQYREFMREIGRPVN